MVFDGDWNGGEREFRLEPGQNMQLHSVRRAGPDGQLLPMRRASDSIGLHEYWWNGSLLRWRARQPTDPPFAETELTYVIDYTLSNIVERDGDHYRLEHDFAFPDRPGAIVRYTLDFDIDPAWRPAPGFEPRIERSGIAPGETLILDIPLQWTGAGQPSSIYTPPPPPPPPPPPVTLFELLMAGAYLLAAALLAAWFVRRERVLGRFEPAPAPTTEWVRDHVLSERADVIGAAWDGETGSGEVAALIAMMTADGKLASEGSADLRLRLLVPRETLSEYERAFVDRLFIAGDTIDRATLRRHYKHSGFDPADSIRHSLEQAAFPLVGKGGTSTVMGCVTLVLALFFAPAVGFAFAGLTGLLAGLAAFFFYGVGVTMIGRYHAEPSAAKAARLIIPLALFVMGVMFFVTTARAAVAFVVLSAFLQLFLFSLARWHGTAEQWLRRRGLRATREMLRRRLERSDPDLEEHWLPYILAFGLSAELDRWSVAAPQRELRDESLSPVGTNVIRAGAAPRALDSPMFRGGGGRFGGAGATGGWARSVRSLAAEVRPPATAPSGGSSGSSWSSGSRSSSSSSSGSSGGSRSGGGRGGGW